MSAYYPILEEVVGLSISALGVVIFSDNRITLNQTKRKIENAVSVSYFTISFCTLFFFQEGLFYLL